MVANAATVLWKFFGPRPGMTMKEFVAEVKALSDEEKQELVDMIYEYQNRKGN